MAQGDHLALVYHVGKWDELSEVSVSVPLESGRHGYGLFQLGERHDGLPYSREDKRTLHETVDILAHTIATTRRLTATITADTGE